METTYEPGRAIRLLGTITRISRSILLVLGVLVIVLLSIAVTGRGSMTIAATLDEPFAVEFDDGRRVGVRSYENFEIGRERDQLAEVNDIGLTVNIARTDIDSRMVMAAMVLTWLAAAWVAVTRLGAIVESALAGETFADENPGRLKMIGYAALASGAAVVIGGAILGQTIDTDLPIKLAIGGSPLWIGLLAALGMFALAEVFGEAARLRQFEEATI